MMLTDGKDFMLLGHSLEYWIELEKQAKSLDYDKLIEEIARLRAKVSFYESRIEEMNHFANRH